MLNPTTELAPDGQPWNLLTLRNDAGMTVTVMDWGATLLSARVTLADGSVREALLGCATPGDYTRQAAYLGASVGRYANRIANSRFSLDGRSVNLTPSNEAGHCQRRRSSRAVFTLLPRWRSGVPRQSDGYGALPPDRR